MRLYATFDIGVVGLIPRFWDETVLLLQMLEVLLQRCFAGWGMFPKGPCARDSDICAIAGYHHGVFIFDLRQELAKSLSGFIRYLDTGNRFC